MMRKTLVATIVAGAFAVGPVSSLAQTVNQIGQAEVSVKSFKDLASARAAARAAAERDAIASALKLRLNLDPNTPQATEAIKDLVKTLSPNLKTTFQTEGEIITARAALSVDSAELTDLSRSLGLQKASAMEAASILFLIDEYWGVATNLDPSKPLIAETEFFQDRSSSASGSSFSDTSSKAASSSSYQGAYAASSKEQASMAASKSASVAGSQSSSMAANRSASVAGSQSSSLAGSSKSAAAAQDGFGGSAAAARQSNIAAANQSSFAGSSQSNVAAANQSSYAGSSQSSMAASRNSDTRVAASVNAASASASENKNVQANAFSQSQTDVTRIKTKMVFPDVNNAKPADAASALIAQRLAQITKKYGLEYTPERDIRETGKGRMLITDIEAQRRFDYYTQLAAKNPYNAKYIVFGSSVMSAEGRTSSGRTQCTGMLKLDSYNVDTGRGLIAGTIAKRAEGTSDQNCRSELAMALATELAQQVGNEATRELQRVARLGQGFTVTLFSAARISRGLGGAFEDALRELAAGDLREDKRTEGTRVYTMSAKGGDLARRIERLLDKLGDEMKNAEVQTKGNRVVVCVEGRCPTDF